MSTTHGGQSRPASPAFVAACERRRRASELRPRVHVTVSACLDTAGRPLSSWRVTMMGYPSREVVTVSVRRDGAATMEEARRAVMAGKQYATLHRGAEAAVLRIEAERAAEAVAS